MANGNGKTLRLVVDICVGIIVLLMGYLLTDLKARIDQSDRALTHALARKIDIEYYTRDYTRVCSDIAEIKANQNNMLNGINDLGKTQQRILQRLDMR